MNRILWTINFIFIAASALADVWAGMALGTSQFESRNAVVLMLLIPCLGFIAFRKSRKR